MQYKLFLFFTTICSNSSKKSMFDYQICSYPKSLIEYIDLENEFPKYRNVEILSTNINDGILFIKFDKPYYLYDVKAYFFESNGEILTNIPCSNAMMEPISLIEFWNKEKSVKTINDIYFLLNEQIPGVVPYNKFMEVLDSPDLISLLEHAKNKVYDKLSFMKFGIQIDNIMLGDAMLFKLLFILKPVNAAYKCKAFTDIVKKFPKTQMHTKDVKNNIPNQYEITILKLLFILLILFLIILLLIQIILYKDYNNTDEDLFK